jgi:hypothetical protein
MFLKAPKNTKKLCKKQDPEETESESVQQDKRGGANDNDASTTVSMGSSSSVLDTPTVNGNPGRSKYGCTYRRTMHYDPTTGRTIGAEAIALANYYLCLEEADDDIEFPNVGAVIGRELENTMELKPMKCKEAVNKPDGEAWAKDIKNEHDQMVKNDAWESVKKTHYQEVPRSYIAHGCARKRAQESYVGISTHADSSKLKVCTTTDQVPTYQLSMLVPSKLC